MASFDWLRTGLKRDICNKHKVFFASLRRRRSLLFFCFGYRDNNLPKHQSLIEN